MCRSSRTAPGHRGAPGSAYRAGTEHMLQRPTTLPHRGGRSQQQHPTTSRHRHVDGPGVLYHTITAIDEADLTPALRGRRIDIARTSSAVGRTPSYWRMTPLGSIGSSAPATTIPSASRSKKTITLTRAGRRRNSSYCGRPACPRWRSSYVPKFAAPTSKF
jgi:hypothetical protein